MRPNSLKGTPLSVKWEEKSIEDASHQNERESDLRRLTALLSAFVIGSILIGLGSWAVGERLWFLHSLGGGLLVSIWLQRWKEKHHKWPATTTETKGKEFYSSAAIVKRRLSYSIPGMLVAAAMILIGAWLSGDRQWLFDIVIAALIGRETALSFGERFKGLTTLNDLALTRMREDMSPLGINPSQIPLSLQPRKKVDVQQ